MFFVPFMVVAAKAATITATEIALVAGITTGYIAAKKKENCKKEKNK